MAQLILASTGTPLREFRDHDLNIVLAVAVLPDRRRMVTGSRDKTLRLWDLQTGVVLKKMEGHRGPVRTLAVSRDGRLIASGDELGEVIAWHGETGESLTQPMKFVEDHSDSGHHWDYGLDFSPNGTVLASASFDRTTTLWNTKTWQMEGSPIKCGDSVVCVRYSPSGELLAIGTTSSIEIYNPGTRERVANLDEEPSFDLDWHQISLAWTSDGTRLLSGGYMDHYTLQEWDASTWQKVGDPWGCQIGIIAINPAGTLVASVSYDNNLDDVRLWCLSDRRNIAICQLASSKSWTKCITFSMDGKRILSGGDDMKITEWAVPDLALQKDAPHATDL